VKRILSFLLLCVLALPLKSFSQDSTKNFHFQETAISQYKPGFSAPYSGRNSLISSQEVESSITTTLFMASKLWKGAQIVFDPELSGGSGLSSTLGVAGFPNGETFRVGGTQNKIYIARTYFRQNFGWGAESDTIRDDINQVQTLRSREYFSFSIGKFGMADFFDNNAFSHDPRSQFMNWSLMDNGAWDYPANTRGYAWGTEVEFGQPTWTLRYAFTLVTTQANQSVWDSRLSKANTSTLEFEERYKISSQPGTFRVLTFLNNGKFGSYHQAIIQNPSSPNVDSTQAYGRHKYGFGISADQYLTRDLGVFARTSYNDGHTETWFFTEIDRSESLGAVLKGVSWKRSHDEVGLAILANELSSDHRDYLSHGGYGFIIGDGKLNYKPEMILELYYKVDFYQEKFWLTPDYQFILHPAYNADRGPVNVMGIRAHIEF